LEDLMWLIKRLEKPMQEFIKKEAKQSLWSKLTRSRKSCMDFHLLKNLEKSESYLKKEFDQFNLRYHEFLFLKGKADEELKKVQYYPILSLLDMQQQDLYIQLMRLLKLMELNPHPKKEVGKETIRALKNLSSVDMVIQLFKVYHHELRSSLFKSSLEWKSLSQEKDLFDEAVTRLKEKIKEDQEELQAFLQIMSQYRRFILKNDSNPYVGSRWGFSEWIVGPEPAKSKEILTLIYHTEELNQLLTRFTSSLNQDSEEMADRKVILEQEIEQTLHEMGQPLISKSMMKKRAEELLEQLHKYDEIGDPSMEAINFVEHTLSVALREDWKYHLLHDFPLFHQIYRLHLGIAGHRHDIAHSSRVNRFNQIMKHIEVWITKDEIYSHIHQIQMDINDLKIYLQEFLASVQRSVKEKSQDPFFDETLHHFYQQLLECRYLFGGFFLLLMKENRDGQELRNQFLFVDQYFESIESLILEARLHYQNQNQDE
ncbi:MAG: hypothetical protein Q8K60_07755, partial [Parachlamydiaceae bacterium]|nr:hypothetical protein [Parachlamydiaceae bacterium]